MSSKDEARVASEIADDPHAGRDRRLGGAVRRRGSRWQRRLLRQKMAIVGTACFALIVLAAVTAPLVVTGETSLNLATRLKPPLTTIGSNYFLLGTDYLGRDVFSRILYGSSVSLFIGTAAVLVSGLFGVTLGIVAGYYGRSWDSLIMRLVDIQLAFPFVLLTIAILGIYGSSTVNIIIVLTITSWPIYARTVRASVLSLKENDYFLAAKSLGASNLWIIHKHVLRNCISPLLVVASYELARMIILESALGFLGLGIQPPTPTWGNMLGEGRQYITSSWWLVTFPGLAIMITVASINFIGDGLRDLFDVRQV